MIQKDGKATGMEVKKGQYRQAIEHWKKLGYEFDERQYMNYQK